MPSLKPKHGVFGTIGPAPGFVWAEVRCTDGTLRSDLKFRRAVVKQARCLNTERYAIAKKYRVPRENVNIAVNSWYRSPAYNKKIGGAKFSQHLDGIATDIRIYVRLRTGKLVLLDPEYTAKLSAKMVVQFQQGGIGWYDRAHGYFTHVDHRNRRARWVNS